MPFDFGSYSFMGLQRTAAELQKLLCISMAIILVSNGYGSQSINRAIYLFLYPLLSSVHLVRWCRSLVLEAIVPSLYTSRVSLYLGF